MTPDDLWRMAALAVTALGLLSSAVVLIRAREVRLPLGVLLDFLLAAGLLRLAVAPTPRSLASAALIVIIRKTVALGLTRRPETPVHARAGVG